MSENITFRNPHDAVDFLIETTNKRIAELKDQLKQKDKVIEVLKSACEFYRDYEDDILSRGYELDCRARQALQQIEDLTQKEKE